MIKSNIFLIISIVMFMIMVGFIIYASRHPELSFPFNIKITYFIYLIYILIMIVLLFKSFIRK